MSALTKQTLIRLPKIKQGLLQRKTRVEIGAICHVTERTIRRDIEAWVLTDDFVNWIRQLWLDLYGKVDDVEAFRQATKILTKSLVWRAEIKEERVERIEVDVTEDEDQILSKAAQILDRKARAGKIH